MVIYFGKMASKRPADFGKSGPSEKKKRLSLSIAQKVELLKKLDSGVPGRSLQYMVKALIFVFS